MKISGYTTVRNVIEMDYPFEEASRSVLAFADEMIAAYAKELEEKTCGHVFHRPWDGSSANGIKINLSHPAIAQKWIDKHKHSRMPLI